MKKILLFTVLLGFSFPVFAQDSNDIKPSKKVKDSAKVKQKWSASSGVKYGIRGGFTISQLDFETAPILGNAHRKAKNFTLD